MYWLPDPRRDWDIQMETNSLHAAQYVRMSTDGQDLSIDIQKQAIQEFAQSNGISIIETYEDAGKSGLRVAGRSEMQRLLRDVAGGSCHFALLLVYDVSRWGRFQDTDASAYYEYHCRMHGVDVVYVKESFGRDSSPMSALLKSLKRTMAAEYSRELSVKIQAGHTRSMQLGFQMGELPSFGFRRLAVGKDGRTRQLERGDRKGKQSDRIRWIPGPPEELDLVRHVFQTFGTTDITLKGLERSLLADGHRLGDGRPITFRTLRTALSCEAFIGNFVWGRKALKVGRLTGDGSNAVRRAEGVLAPLITKEIWDAVQAKLKRTPMQIRRSRDRLIADLRAAFQLNPQVSTLDMREWGCASGPVYNREFSSIYEAMRLAGIDLGAIHDVRMAAASKHHRLPRQFTKDLLLLLQDAGLECCALLHPLQGIAVSGIRVRVQSVWPRIREGRMRWWFSRTGRSVQDYLLLVRFQDDGTAYDMLLMPRTVCDGLPVWLDKELPNIAVQQLRSAADLVAQFTALSGIVREEQP
jgi:DNA invertase Pin-like site-specific DNA recombinase